MSTRFAGPRTGGLHAKQRLLLVFVGCLCSMPIAGRIALKAAMIQATLEWSSFEELLDMAQSRSNRRSNEHNGNNEAYWRKRGYDGRPDNWEERYAAIRAERQKAGRLEHETNHAASRSPDQKRAASRDTVKVMEAIREALAPQAKVIVAGSRAKKTDLATSDQDYYIDWETSVTLQHRDELQEELEKRFPGAVEITKHGTLRVAGESGQLCITFAHALFYDESFEERARLDKDAFKGNRPAQQAVRAVKMKLQDAGIKLKGHTLEYAVLKVQEEHPYAGFYDLAMKTLDALGLRRVF
ncbi:unnamed protein product [Symbiodinium necroappetens]|uniref:Polymerase nucleotidyl transferase domain-containing protein n=1 Tax=Symbiodinium necroappetens TaxID=1628268 RepID=A0A812NN94_9DINO|nr:unnamed protein product [Symbiodinium necroappetens]